MTSLISMQDISFMHHLTKGQRAALVSELNTGASVKVAIRRLELQEPLAAALQANNTDLARIAGSVQGYMGNENGPLQDDAIENDALPQDKEAILYQLEQHTPLLINHKAANIAMRALGLDTSLPQDLLTTLDIPLIAAGYLGPREIARLGKEARQSAEFQKACTPEEEAAAKVKAQRTLILEQLLAGQLSIAQVLERL